MVIPNVKVGKIKLEFHNFVKKIFGRVFRSDFLTSFFPIKYILSFNGNYKNLENFFELQEIIANSCKLEPTNPKQYLKIK